MRTEPQTTDDETRTLAGMDGYILLGCYAVPVEGLFRSGRKTVLSNFQDNGLEEGSCGARCSSEDSTVLREGQIEFPYVAVQDGEYVHNVSSPQYNCFSCC
jgi:hypothetical protein